MSDWCPEDRGLHSLKSRHAYICDNTLPCPFVALCCSKSEIGSLPELGTHSKSNCKQRQTGASQWIFAQGDSMHASSIFRNRAEAVHGFVCQFIADLDYFVYKLGFCNYLDCKYLFGTVLFIRTLSTRAIL